MSVNDFLVRTFGQIVLASSSPRRAHILEQVGFDFLVEPSHVQEEFQNTHPIESAKKLAFEKARTVAARFPDRIVLGADTIVVLEGRMLGKPEDADDAERMLSFLSGRTHQVHTAYALYRQRDGRRVVSAATTDVTFLSLNAEDIQRYVATGSPFDKAGAYGIQDASAVFVERIDGDFYNVVGLPIARVYKDLFIHFQSAELA
jgi:septum formation protein